MNCHSRQRARPCGAPRTALIAVVVAALAPLGASAQEQPELPTLPPHFAITGARIVPVSGAVIENGTVVVDDGLIQAVGRDARVPEDAWVMDGAGLTVYPGLIDAMGTLGHPTARSAGSGGAGFGPPGAGGTGGASDEAYSWGPEDRPGTFTWRSAADELDAEDGRIERWRDAGFTSALTTFGSGIFTGSSALIDLAGDRGRAMVIAPHAAQRVNLSSREFPGYPNSLLGVFAYIKQLHYDADHYDAAQTAYEASARGRTRPEYDRTLEPLRNHPPLLFPASGRKEILRAIAIGRDVDAPVIVYGGTQAYQATDALASAAIPVLVDLDWPEPERNGDPEAEPTLAELRSWEHAPTTPALLREAGVPFAFYTGGLTDPSEVRANVEKAVEAGLPRDAAIRALTLSAAEILGVSDRLGSIEPGKIANLVVVRGDLLDPDAAIETVIVDGRSFPVFHPTAVAGRGGRGGPGGRGAGGAGAGGAEQEDAGAESEADLPTGPVADAAADPAAQAIVPMVEDRGPYRDDAVTLIRNATVMTVANGTIEGGDVLIRDGRIAAVGPSLDAPGNARVVDATGMVVTPGIIDAHSHIAADAINEGSINSSAMVAMRDVIDPNAPEIYRALAGGVTSINLLHGSANPIGGQNAVLKLRWGSDAADLLFEAAPPGIKFALGENTTRDRNPDRYPSTRMGVQDVIRQAFLDAQEYQREWDAYNALSSREKRNAVAPRRDLEMEALAQVLSGERLVHAHSYRADEILQLLRTAEDFGFRIATLQHVLEGYKIADEIAAHGAGASTFSDWWAYKVEAYDAIPYNAALMTERGVVVSINSDDAEEMRHLNQEAGKTMKWGGMSELEALKMVTQNPAIQLHVQDHVGTIEVGKDADLVVFQGDPLTIDAMVRQTYVDGKLYFDVDLDHQRRAAIEREKSALMEKFLPGRVPPRVTTTTNDVANPQTPITSEEVQR